MLNPYFRLGAPLLVVLVLLTASCAEESAKPQSSSVVELTPTVSPAPASEPASASASASAAPETQDVTMVVAVSVDGLKPEALESLGRSGAPNFWRLMHEGASTLNARTPVEMTATLPSHTTMMTGRRISADDGGHGYTTNVETATGRVLDLSSKPVPSVYNAVHDAGLRSALFASKDKFSVFDRTWPVLDEFVVDPDNARLLAAAERDLISHQPAFTFVHLSWPDKAGHATRWMSPTYLNAVRDVDALIGELLDTIDRTPNLRDHLVLVVTADHGGEGLEHGDPRDRDDYTIPFLVRGPGVPADVDLYTLNPQRQDPGNGQPGYDAPRQPIRNGDVANLATELLGLEVLPSSQMGVDDPLLVRR